MCKEGEKRTITDEQFAQYTRPRLLLFLSVDMENSTRLKQSGGDRLNEDWLGSVVTFVDQFPQTLKAQAERIAREEERTKPLFSLWKVLGDELVFVAEITSRTSVPIYIKAFRDAISTWNAETRKANKKTRLLVKGAAWIAGFPVANAVLVTGQAAEDYVGPSVDAGFRIAKLASNRRLAISVELAWLLLKCGSDMRVHFEGPVVMKGVAEERGYPHLWVEVGDSAYQALEDELRGHAGQADREKMTKLCGAFVQEFGVPGHLPFLPNESEFTPPPPNFENALTSACQFLRQEVYIVTGNIDGLPVTNAEEFSVQAGGMLEKLKKETE